MRVFVPATLGMLETLRDEGAMPVRSGTAFAATPALVESFAEGDLEEIEALAFLEAARASLRLVGGEQDAADGGGDGTGAAASRDRRVVVSADVDDDALTLRPDLDTAVVRLAEPLLPLAAVAALHVDLAAAEPAVRAAVEAVDRADLGDEDAELTVGDALDLDLAWYDPVELPFLLDLL